MKARAVCLADKRRPNHIRGMLTEKSMSAQDRFKTVMADGGTVLICQGCAKAAGLTTDDCIDGVQMGSVLVIESWLVDPMTKLAW